MRRKTESTRIVVGIVLGCLAASLHVQANSEPEYEMTTYQFVLLHRGAERSPIGERGIQRLQQERLAYFDRLNRDGKLILEGPVDGGGDLRGVVVLDAGSVEQAEELMAGDPWIAAGRIRPEIHPWWAAKGILQQPERLDRTSRCWLGLLKRPEGAPDHYSDEELQKIQAGHMENISRMAASGDLVIAGPMGDDGVLRGIFLFRTQDSAHIVEMFKRDPAHAAGRLELELYPWHVPAGTIPEKP
jgi:uncharacterized protein YciI